MDDFIPLKSPFQDGSIVDEYHHESPVIVDYHPLSISSISMIQWNMYIYIIHYNHYQWILKSPLPFPMIVTVEYGIHAHYPMGKTF